MTEATPLSPERRFLVVGVVVLSVAALVGPTLLLFRGGRSSAAFGDQEAVGVNHLGAATLDIEVGETTSRLSAEQMAPGDRVVGWLDLTNRGDVDLHYSLLAASGDSAIIDWLRWDIWLAATCAGSPPFTTRLVADEKLARAGTAALLGDPRVGFDSGDRVMAAGDEERLCVAATLPANTPNDLQGRELVVDLQVTAEHHLEGEE